MIRSQTILPDFYCDYYKGPTNENDEILKPEVFPDLVRLLDKSPEERQNLRIRQI